MLRILQIALRNLWQHKRRTMLLGGAIAGVTLLLVVLMGLSNGVQTTMLESATTLMTGHINIGGFFKVTAGQSAPLVTDYPRIVDLVKKNVPEVDFITVRGRGWAKLISDSGSMQVGIGGVDVTQEQGFRRVLKITSGRLEDLANPGTILIFEEQAKKLEVKVGDQLTISAPSARGANNTVDVRVAAIAENIGLFSSFNTYVASPTLRQLYQLNESSTGAVLIYLKQLKDVPRVEDDVRKLLTANGYLLLDPDPNAFWMKFAAVNREDWTGQKLDVTSWEDEISFIKRLASSIDALTYALMTVLLIIIAVGIMNALWIAIRERTREIGTLRAIGMQRTRVLAMFVLEALALGAISTLTGAVLGLLLCAVLNAAHVPVIQAARLIVMRDTLLFQVNGLILVRAMAIITFCATAISLVPSFIAAQMKPVTAMHHVG